MAPRGCWTCKDRKVSCDRTFPKCLKCTKTKRECGGYGVRLTWPQKKHDRVLVGCALSKRSGVASHNGAHQWVNVVPTDIRLHLVTGTSMGKVGSTVNEEQLTFPNIPELSCFTSSNIASNDLELIRYFEVVVVDLLPMLGTDRANLGQLLVQAALSNRSQSSKAIYHSILALASYHRGGNRVNVDLLKRAALRNLRTHTDPGMCEGAEHVAANLLLCVLEMQQTSDKNSGWVVYISGVKKVIDAVKNAQPAPGSCEASIVLGWVYYFDVMARFSFRHWRAERVRAIANDFDFDFKGSSSCALQYTLVRASFAQEIPNISNHAHPVIQLLFEVANTTMYSSNPKYLSTEYQQYLDDLRSRLENVSSRALVFDSSPKEKLDHTEQLLELTRLAGLIYLERVSRNFSGHSTEIESWTKRALSILAQLETCLCPFALFIIGCETETDEDRMIILDLYTRMEKRPHFRSFLETKALIQTAWNQKDLAEDGKVEYIHKLDLVLSSRNVIPSLI